MILGRRHGLRGPGLMAGRMGTMMDFIPTTLALSTGEIISLLIAAGVILSGIFGSAAEAKKTQRKREALKRGDAPGGSSELDEIARRRRQQLEALARQRRQGAGGASGESQAATPPVATAAPSRLNIERQTERDVYAQGETAKRAMDEVNPMLAHGSGGSKQSGRQAEIAAMEARRAERTQDRANEGATRDDVLRARREAASQRRQQREQPARRTPVRLREPARQQPAPEPVPQPPARSVSRVALAETSVHDDAYAQVEFPKHSSYSDAADSGDAAPVARPSRIAGLMQGRSWRDVIMLKEILDPSISMRQDTGPIDPFAR